MFLICYGTRPELIKLAPLIWGLKKCKIEYHTVFSGQHRDLIEQYKDWVDKPTYNLQNVFKVGQSLNELFGKILFEMQKILSQRNYVVIVQGDTTTSLAVAMASYNTQSKVIHLEAGLRTADKYSPYPEEMNRRIISQIADIHLCPTRLSVQNLNREGIKDGVYLVGNSVVDVFANFSKVAIDMKGMKKDYILVTLHRRENRGDKMKSMWDALNRLSSKYNFVYITHPSLPDSVSYLCDRIQKLPPQGYQQMIGLMIGCKGIITDSGGLQEEAVCANKRVLVCRDTTERPETIECGLGLLIDTEIEKNIDFLDMSMKKDVIDNPYGSNVVQKIMRIICQ